MKRVAILVAILALAGLAPVSAQTSNTSNVTGGIFTQDFDNIVDSVEWTQIKKGTASVLFGQGSNGFTSLMVANGNLFGSLYWGNALYVGAVSMQTSGNSETKSSVTTDTFDPATWAYVGKSVLEKKIVDWRDQAALYWNTTVGLGGLGGLSAFASYSPNVRHGDFGISTPGVGVWTSSPSSPSGTGAQVTKNYNAAGVLATESGNQYDMGQSDSSSSMLNLHYGTTLPMGNANLKLNAGIDTLASSNRTTGGNTLFNRTYQAGLPGNESHNKKSQAIMDSGFLDLTPSLKAIYEVKSGTTTWSVGATYSLDMPIYFNAYTDENGASKTDGGYVVAFTETEKTISTSSGILQQTIKTTREWENEKISSMTHSLTPLFTAKAAISPTISLGFSYAPGFSLETSTNEWSAGSRVVTDFTSNLAMADPTSDNQIVQTKSYSGYKDTTTTFIWTNPVNVGAEFTVVPQTFMLTAGTTITVPTYQRVSRTIKADGLILTTSKTTLGNGTVSASSASLTTVQGQNQAGMGSFGVSDLQADQSAIQASTIAAFRVGAVYNLTPDTFADLAFAMSGNSLMANQLTVQITSRY